MLSQCPNVILIGGFGGVPGSTSCRHAVDRGSIPGADDTPARGKHDARSVLDSGLPGTHSNASVLLHFTHGMESKSRVGQLFVKVLMATNLLVS